MKDLLVWGILGLLVSSTLLWVFIALDIAGFGWASVVGTVALAGLLSSTLVTYIELVTSWKNRNG